MFSQPLQQLCYRVSLAFALVLVLGTSARAQYAGAYTGYTVSNDGNNNPVLDAWTVESGGMSGSGSCGSDQYTHDYYAYAQINGPNGTYSPYPTTNSTGGGASCPMSTRIDALIPLQYLGTYTITQRGWAYCSFVGSGTPFADTGDMTTNFQLTLDDLTNAIADWTDLGNGSYQVTMSFPAYDILSAYGYMQSGTIIDLPPCAIPEPRLCSIYNGGRVLVKYGPLVGAALYELWLTWRGRVPSPYGWPGDDGTVAPGPDWTWQGPDPPGGQKGNWTKQNPDGTRENLHPDLNHDPPEGPHWDYQDPSGGKGWRVWPDGTMTAKP